MDRNRNKHNQNPLSRIYSHIPLHLRKHCYGMGTLIAFVVCMLFLDLLGFRGLDAKEPETLTTKQEVSAQVAKVDFQAKYDEAVKAQEPAYIWASPAGVAEGEGAIEDTVGENDPSLQEGQTKVMYLTFDDGPNQYTQELLDILAAHNAKVTFFVTNQDPDYAYLIKAEADAGHSIAVHTYSHDYNSIYSSSEAFWDDFNSMQDVIQEQTGYRSELMRFPGGSSNTISGFNEGIMTQLTQEAEAKGYTYFDWNASSGDGNVQTTTESVYANSTAESSYSDTVVLLCHDVKKSTVDAMDQFLTWGEENGYVFLPLSPNSFPAHHGVNN